MNRLLIVSNRLPVSVERRKNELRFSSSVGGLATGLNALHQRYKSLWVGWPGIAINKEETDYVESKLSEFNCYPVFLSQGEVEKYYYGFSNKTLWPLFHYFPQYAKYEHSEWSVYEHVNRDFFERVAEIAKPEDVIWIHDYHLMLLPGIIRERFPDATIGFFLHIPFPSADLFRLIPWRRRILEGVLGADHIGFHTYDYAHNFLSSVLRLLGYEHEFWKLAIGDRIVQVDVHPMGIEVQKFVSATSGRGIKRDVARLRSRFKNCKIIFSMDRLDYTKGIPERLFAFELFLETHPEWHEKVVFILKIAPSRTKVGQYRVLKQKIDELVGRINGKYGTPEWVPISYFYRSLPFQTIIAFYLAADVALLTSMRDGMNLIAKEFVASRVDGKGVLILSEMAGAARELGEALVVNSNNKEEVAEALNEALRMPEEEQKSRNEEMQKRLSHYDVFHWGSGFIRSVLETKRLQEELNMKKLSEKIREELKNSYKAADKRLLLLDYDGTLVPFADKPERAKPDKELLDLFRALSEPPENTVVIISGRDKETLERWFGDTGVCLVAEHGVWLREKEGEWKEIELLKEDWKEKIIPILDLFVDRAPGSFIEEKRFSLVWHYRKVDPELGELRAKELTDQLIDLTACTELQVMKGNKVVEVKDGRVNKGIAASHWLTKGFGFILAVGDDLTDEDMFKVLPEGAYSVKIGFTPSKARFYLGSPKEVRALLDEMEMVEVYK